MPHKGKRRLMASEALHSPSNLKVEKKVVYGEQCETKTPKRKKAWVIKILIKPIKQAAKKSLKKIYKSNENALKA
jgi:hypothetical protein